jgi:hypothetical protein
LKLGLPLAVREAIAGVLRDSPQVPWGAPTWLHKRTLPLLPSTTSSNNFGGGAPATAASGPWVSARVPPPTHVRADGVDDSCVFVGMTTYQRYAQFHDTLSRLLATYGPPRSAGVSAAAAAPPAPAAGAFCHIVVVDDGSSAEDRQQMLRDFGDVVEFVFKPPGGADTGHAESLNRLVALAAARGARYFLYVEDDWSLVEDAEEPAPSPSPNPPAVPQPGEAAAPTLASGPSTPPQAQPRTQPRVLSAISAAVAILAAAPPEEPLAQVHLNSQSAKACAHHTRVDLSDEQCRAFIRADGSGWPRRTPGGVEYRLHEWGLPQRRPLHYSSWPGFTLNPAVWDLQHLRRVLGDPLVRPPARAWEDGNEEEEEVKGEGKEEEEEDECHTPATAPPQPRQQPPPSVPPPNVWFNPHDVTFERRFSLRVAAAGLRVGYLDQLTLRHTGVGASVYKLTNQHRPWDL